MFHFGGFPSLYYLIHIMILDSSSRWFPNSEICGSSLIYSYPQLIAVSHVLLRLPMPRHSPYALFRLNFPICMCISAHTRFLSQIILFGCFYFTVNFAFCAKCSFLPTIQKDSCYYFFSSFLKITLVFSQLSVSFSFFIRFSMNIFRLGCEFC